AAAGARSLRGRFGGQPRRHSGAGGGRFRVRHIRVSALQPQSGKGFARALARRRGIGRHGISRRTTVMAEVIAEEKPETSAGGRRVRIAAIAVVVLAAIVLVVWLRSRGHESTDDAQVDGRITLISA